MRSSKRAVRITANFERNLAGIGRFLEGRDAGLAFGALLEDLFDTVIPNLETFPEIGRDFLARVPLSVEGLARWEKVFRRSRKRGQLREYIAGDYLILYLAGDNGVALLAIRHHLQLSFDLKMHWT